MNASIYIVLEIDELKESLVEEVGLPNHRRARQICSIRPESPKLTH